jgi:hypothetical protein
MDRIGRSFELAGQSWRLLMQDSELMLLPLVSGAVIAAVVLTFFVGVGLDPAVVQQRGTDFYVPLFVLYVVLYAVGTFFQCAVVAGATERMRGGEPTLGSALVAAGRRIVAIVIWSIFAATIGVGLRAVQDRVGLVGKVVVALLGAVWSLATFFVVPVLVLEDVSPGEVLGRSVSLIRDTWGEAVVGSAGLGLASFFSSLLLVAVCILVTPLGYGAAFVVFGTGAILLTIVFSALQGIYVAALYRYATEGDAPAFDKWLLKDAFKPS